MKYQKEAILLRIFITESDMYKEENLYQFLVGFLKDHGFQGVTVFRGIEGFGKSHIVHTSHLLELASDLPIVLEIVDEEKKIHDLIDYLETHKVMKSGLLTQEKIQMIYFDSE